MSNLQQLCVVKRVCTPEHEETSREKKQDSWGPLFAHWAIKINLPWLEGGTQNYLQAMQKLGCIVISIFFKGSLYNTYPNSCFLLFIWIPNRQTQQLLFLGYEQNKDTVSAHKAWLVDCNKKWETQSKLSNKAIYLQQNKQNQQNLWMGGICKVVYGEHEWKWAAWMLCCKNKEKGNQKSQRRDFDMRSSAQGNCGFTSQLGLQPWKQKAKQQQCEPSRKSVTQHSVALKSGAELRSMSTVSCEDTHKGGK